MRSCSPASPASRCSSPSSASPVSWRSRSARARVSSACASRWDRRRGGLLATVVSEGAAIVGDWHRRRRGGRLRLRARRRRARASAAPGRPGAARRRRWCSSPRPSSPRWCRPRAHRASTWSRRCGLRMRRIYARVRIAPPLARRRCRRARRASLVRHADLLPDIALCAVFGRSRVRTAGRRVVAVLQPRAVARARRRDRRSRSLR